MRTEAHIGEIVLRVPGLTAARAQRLSEAVLERVRTGLPAEFQAVDLSGVDLRVHVPLGLSDEDLADRVAKAILAQLRPGGADV